MKDGAPDMRFDMTCYYSSPKPLGTRSIWHYAIREQLMSTSELGGPSRKSYPDFGIDPAGFFGSCLLLPVCLESKLTS